MDFPIYKITDLDREIAEGNYYNSDFARFIEELIHLNEFEDDTEKGIASKVNSEGTYSLSDKQSYYIQKIYNRYNNKRCTVCGEIIPINEVLYLDGNLCSYHENYLDNE